MNRFNLILISFILLIYETNSFDKKMFCNCKLSDDKDNNFLITNENLNFPFIVSLGKLSWSLKFFTGKFLIIYKLQSSNLKIDFFNRSFQIDKHKMETHLCSGVILNEQFILTTASCLINNLNVDENKETKKIGVGLNNKDNDLIAIYDQGRIPINRTFKHPLFNSTTYENDIALVELTETIKFNDSRFRPICLLEKGKCWFNKMNSLGWGSFSIHHLDHQKIQSSDIKYLRYLGETNLEDISFIAKDCFKQSTRLCMRSIDRTIVNTKICKNDQGSPLMFTEDGKITVIGLFSYYSFNEKNSNNICQSIGIYTKVSPYLQFIKDHIDDNFCYF